MKIFMDSEFIEDGTTIDLISIGLVRSDGEEFYAEIDDIEIPWEKADQWVLDNVRPLLHLGPEDKVRKDILAEQLLEFCGRRPEFWANYGAYDWVVLARLFGPLPAIPNHWPRFCRDIQQFREQEHVSPAELPKQEGAVHDALEDARWNAAAWRYLNRKKRSRLDIMQAIG